jgi:thioredoxin-related protein
MRILRGGVLAERITTAVSIAVVLVCAVVIFRARTPVSLASIAESSVLTDSGRYTALIVFQEKDCESNLRLLSLFERPRIRPYFRERGLLLASGYFPDNRLVETVRTALPDFGFRRGSPREWRTLERMGVVQTPHLIVLDGTGQVVYSAPAPADPAEYVELTRGLTSLADAAAAGVPPLPLPVP